jgi:quinohemoprotein ethanol dehydrogenase
MNVSETVRCRLALLLVLFPWISCQGKPSGDTAPQRASHQEGWVDEVRLASADREPGQWLTGGRDAEGTYFSPLREINTSNVHRLGFAWEYRTGTRRGLEATPIVVDGVMYTSGNWGRVYALDAVTGKLLWTFDPMNEGQRARFACCDVVNRGVAVWQGGVYVASTDGHLFALDERTGKPRWSVDTIVDHSLPYTSSGAPQIAGGAVVIGNGGADIGKHGVRGYVSAYELATGKLKWRFYTVPGPRRAPDPNMSAEEKSWDPARAPDMQGGGTVWDGMAYDPALKLVYIGVGNASPYYRRSAATGAPYDDLYLACIVALDAQTGKVAWYYQTAPGEIWDYTATAKMVLADLEIDGRRREVLMQAPKNGFFYVLDRKTGRPISAKPYTRQNWTLGLDDNFRPIINKDADYGDTPKLITPSVMGARGWQPMSFSRQTGFVYIPVTEATNWLLNLDKNKGALIQHIDGIFGDGLAVIDSSYRRENVESVYGKLPDLEVEATLRNKLLAWDPVHQTVAWERETWNGLRVAPGGVMTNAGGLVFQGDPFGKLNIYSAISGELLKSIATGTAIMAAPMTYRVRGVEYVAVMAGWGGGMMFAPFPPGSAPDRYENEGRILVFKLDGGDTPLPATRVVKPFNRPPVLSASSQQITSGLRLYIEHCARCHLFGPSIIPDLRKPDLGSWDFNTLKSILLDGVLASQGMGSFGDTLSIEDVENIRAFVNDESWKAYRAQSQAVTGTGRADNRPNARQQ